MFDHFLFWLLVRRLVLGLPTALQVDKPYAILFHDKGVSEFRHLTSHPEYDALEFLPDNPSYRIWALIDSNTLLPEPAGIFVHNSCFFVVNAGSPRSKHRDWQKKIGCDFFYMNPWSLSEVIQACMYLSSF